MNAPQPAMTLDKSIKDIIGDDLKQSFKSILLKYLDDRTYNEKKIRNWTSNILLDCKEYFIKKYNDYDLFLICFICERNVYYREGCRSISIIKTDGSDSADLQTEYLYCAINFFYYKHYNLDYSITDFEADIIKKGSDILFKHLENRKYNYDKLDNYNNNINTEHNDYILEKCNKLRCFTINRIFDNPIKGKFDFNYLSYGKDIYRTIFQSYQNDSLICNHDVFFFKHEEFS